MGTSWTPDGNILAFQETHPETGDNISLLSIRDRTTEAFLHTEFNEYDAYFSPNGRWIVYESNESGRSEIYVRPFPKAPGKWQVSTEGGAFGRWNPNGRELFYRNGNKMMVVDVTTERELTLGVPKILFETDLSMPYDVTSDGQRFVMAARPTRQVAPRELVLVQNWSEELKSIVPLN